MNHRPLLVAALALLLTGCSLAADVTPPPALATQAARPVQPTTPPQPVSVGYPAENPSAARGAAIFAEHCAPCHGPQGDGDGEFAAQLPRQPAAFSDPELARNASPTGWFEAVTSGNLENRMPPFASALTESQRWDVVFYLYTLSAPPETLGLGRELYRANCAPCHGSQGKGDGPGAADLAAPPRDFSDQAFMVDRTQADFFGVISKGLGENMPGFANTLTEDERWTIAAALRTFTFDAPLTTPEEQVAAQPEATPDAQAPVGAAPDEPASESPVALPETARLSGLIVNATAGGTIPDDLTVIVHGFDDFNETLSLTTTVETDGSYLLPEFPLLPDRALIATVEHEGVLYASQIVRVDGTQTDFDLPVTIYDATTDASAAQIEQFHIILEVQGDQVRAGELYVISNRGDKTIRSATEGGPVLEFALPEGAASLTFPDDESGDRYLQTAPESTGVGFADTTIIRPGEENHRVLVSFTMPYSGKLDFRQSVNYHVAALNVLLPEGEARLQSDHLQSLGVRQVQSESYEIFTGGALEPGQALEFTLSGNLASALTVASPQGGSELLIGAGALGLVLIGLGVWWFRRSAGDEDVSGDDLEDRPPPSFRDLVHAIAALDDDFAAGQIDEADYRQRRARLKRRALELME